MTFNEVVERIRNSSMLTIRDNMKPRVSCGKVYMNPVWSTPMQVMELTLVDKDYEYEESITIERCDTFNRLSYLESIGETDTKEYEFLLIACYIIENYSYPPQSVGNGLTIYRIDTTSLDEDGDIDE